MDTDALNDLTKRPSPDSYRNARRFPHAVIDEFLRPEIAVELAATFPPPSADCWYRYANPPERKLAYNVPGKGSGLALSADVYRVFERSE